MKRPNFLFIITDQQRADYLGCMGHPLLKTPSIDTIAAEGVRFNRFYTANPVCMPNRATLMTGRMPSCHGVRNNGIALSLQANTFVDLLRDSGYHTALIGKSHLQNFTGLPPFQKREAKAGEPPLPDAERAEALKPHITASGAYDQEHPASWSDLEFQMQLPFYGFEHVDLCTLHGDQVGAQYKTWLRSQRADADQLTGPENSLPHDYICPQTWRTAVPEALYPTNYIADQSIAYLQQYAKQAGDNPFFLMMSFPDPHHPFTPPGRYWDMYRPEDMILPESFHRISNDPPPPLAWVYENRVEGKADRSKGQFMSVINERELREAIALTCGMITMIDDALGRVLSHLHELGLADDTVIVFTSDHGDFLGDHRLLLKGPIHFQSLIRTAFIWRDPDLPHHDVSTDALAGTVDIASTILDRAVVAPYNGIQGRSLLPEINTLQDHGPGCVLIEDDQQRSVFGFESSPRVHSLITERWRMSIFHDTDWGELYDLKNDPLENENLWFSPEYSATKMELLEQFVRREIALVDRSPLASARA